MKLSRKGELELLEKIRRSFAVGRTGVLTGIGDDSAVLARARKGQKTLVSTDMMLEGVHFDLSYFTFRQLGFKLVSVNASDIYAMGGTPAYLLLGLALPPGADERDIDGFIEGVAEGCGHYGMDVVGGDLSAFAGGAVLCATIIGFAEKPVERAGAKPGHRIYVTGTLGDSACGLELLKRIGRRIDFSKPKNRPFKWQLMERLLKRHLMPDARSPRAFRNRASAMIDLSDGLLIDLTRLCIESGVGAEIYEDRVPVSKECSAVAKGLGLEPLQLVLKGGEDYEMLFTAPSRCKVAGAREIGRITKSGTYIIGHDGRRRHFGPEGYTHFSKKK